jgi:hypothetical protein
MPQIKRSHVQIASREAIKHMHDGLLERANVYVVYEKNTREEVIEDMVDYLKSKDVAQYMIQKFDDWKDPRWEGSPTKKEVSQALLWSQYGIGGGGNWIVCCACGKSRSSAMAYSMLCNARGVSYTEAINVLDGKLHWPNDLIIQHTAEIIEESGRYGKGVIEVMDDWKNKHFDPVKASKKKVLSPGERAKERA